MLGKIIQVNKIANAIITTGQRRSTYLVSYSKKIRVWHKRFRYTGNARIICASNLLTRIRDFSANYNQAKIYSNFETSESENLIIDNFDLPSKKRITLKALKITDCRSDFDKICKPYKEKKQIHVIYK